MMSLFYPLLMNETAVEIGSEFWLDSSPEEKEIIIPSWLKEFGDPVLTSSGRGAITLILNQIKPKTKSVLLPEYICESVVSPFIEKGYICHFYRINKDLSPNNEDIEQFYDIGIFLHMGYYGFPTNSKLENILSNFKERNVVVIEDVTHTLFLRTNRYIDNDFYIGSIRKWFGTPSGGFAASAKDSTRKLKCPTIENKKISDLREEALIDKGQYMLKNLAPYKEIALKKFSEAEMLLNSDMTPYLIDRSSGILIGTIDVKELMKKRVVNFIELSKGLSSLNNVEPIFKDIKENVCPIFYPVLVRGSKSELRKKLVEERIYCPVHWPLPRPIEGEKLSSSTIDIYDNILSIPCDQRYSIEDMKRVISVFKSF